jgi:hypothetical protein
MMVGAPDSENFDIAILAENPMSEAYASKLSAMFRRSQISVYTDFRGKLNKRYDRAFTLRSKLILMVDSQVLECKALVRVKDGGGGSSEEFDQKIWQIFSTNFNVEQRPLESGFGLVTVKILDEAISSRSRA